MFLCNLRWEWGQALAKLPRRWWKSLSLNMLSLKKASSWKNTSDTPAIDVVLWGGWEGGSSCSRVRVSPPIESRKSASCLSCSVWVLWARPAKGKMLSWDVCVLRTEKWFLSVYFFPTGIKTCFSCDERSSKFTKVSNSKLVDRVDWHWLWWEWLWVSVFL